MKKNDTNAKDDALMADIVSLCKRRGFVYPGSEIYGGLANSWDFGPLGVALKNNIKQLWWKMFVEQRDDMYGIDAAIIMNPKVWEASGHVDGFSDPLVDCKACKNRFRADTLLEDKGLKRYIGDLDKMFEEGDVVCPKCGKKELTKPRYFNLLFKTYVGAVEDDKSVAYLRGETAQGMFVNFKHILDSFSPAIPFGMAQIGKAFRNEITPGNFIFRTREFEQMEIEYFVRPDEWEAQFENWLGEMKRWMKKVGIDEKKVSFLDIPEDDRAHYSKKTVDIEFDFPFGKDELFGLAYRGDFDLRVHQEKSGSKLEYFDTERKERFIPHVIEPSLGVERTMLALLVSAYRKDEERVWLDFNIGVAPYKAAVFPLLANKPELVKKAREVHTQLVNLGIGPIAFDDNGNVGKRYRRQDEIGTPYCVTVDFDTIESGKVTVRDRNTMAQEKVSLSDIEAFFVEKMRA